MRKTLVPLVIAAVVAGSVLVARILTPPSSPTTSCGAPHHTVTLNVQHNHFAPAHLQAHRCDRLTIRNVDPVDRLIAFGPHDHHIFYDGISERLLKHGQSLTITLVTPGSLLVHDHLDDSVQTTITILPLPAN